MGKTADTTPSEKKLMTYPPVISSVGLTSSYALVHHLAFVGGSTSGISSSAKDHQGTVAGIEAGRINRHSLSSSPLLLSH